MQTYRIAIFGEKDWVDTLTWKAQDIAHLRRRVISDMQTDVYDVFPEIFDSKGNLIGAICGRYTPKGFIYVWVKPISKKPIHFSNRGAWWKKTKETVIDPRTGNLIGGKKVIINEKKWW